MIEIKQLIDEDFIMYKKPSMHIGMPYCSFKCDKECGQQICQNSNLAKAPIINIDKRELVIRYISNPITSAIVFAGLEPFDTFSDLISIITLFRGKTEDDIVIYTGYYPYEIEHYINQLKEIKNITIKFGRYIPNRPDTHDNVLGIVLASDNQFGQVIS